VAYKRHRLGENLGFSGPSVKDRSS